VAVVPEEVGHDERIGKVMGHPRPLGPTGVTSSEWFWSAQHFVIVLRTADQKAIQSRWGSWRAGLCGESVEVRIAGKIAALVLWVRKIPAEALTDQ